MLVMIMVIVIIVIVMLRLVHLMKLVKLGLYRKHFQMVKKYQISMKNVPQVLNEHLFIGEIVMRLLVMHMIMIQGYQFVSVHIGVHTLRIDVNG